MKNFLAPLLCLGLTGCGSLFMVNIGSATHEAASVGPALAPEVQCAALAQSSVKIDGASIDAVKICEQAVAEQKLIDKHKGGK
jgi:hypothetical protein